MTFVFTEKHVLTLYVSYSSKICVSTFSKTNVSDSGPRSGWGILIYSDSSVVILSFSFFIPLFWVLVILWESVKYRYIEFFIFHYDSLPISFQSGITFFL